ncbi:MAG: TraB/GumN family protein [Gammaproteobacteria bacterium]|nr:TraB/GumN family protein [Gammaproteobacteria bacterium]
MVKRLCARRWVRSVVALWLAWLLAAPSFAAQGLVYAITRDGMPRSYLVGTMHTEDPRVIGLLVEFGPLIEAVDTVALEMQPDGVTMLAVGAASMLPVDRRLRDIIGCRRFAALRDAADSLGLAIELLDRLQPWAAAVTLGMPAPDSGRFLDMEIYLHALEHGRRTVGLETAAEQLAVFQRMPMPLQIALLDEMIKNADQLPTQFESLTQAFLSGDLDKIDEVARAQYADMPPDMVDWFNSALLDERNARMLERIRPLLAEGASLVAVGALHLGGDSGLVNGLRGLGFDVRRWPR